MLFNILKHSLQFLFYVFRLENNTDDHKRTASPLSAPRSESPSALHLNNLAGNDKADEDADQHGKPAEEKENEPDPDEVSDDLQSDQKFTIAPEQPGLKTTLSELDSELSQGKHTQIEKEKHEKSKLQ